MFYRIECPLFDLLGKSFIYGRHGGFVKCFDWIEKKDIFDQCLYQWPQTIGLTQTK